jgi:hypothetical protein
MFPLSFRSKIAKFLEIRKITPAYYFDVEGFGIFRYY